MTNEYIHNPCQMKDDRFFNRGDTISHSCSCVLANCRSNSSLYINNQYDISRNNINFEIEFLMH